MKHTYTYKIGETLLDIPKNEVKRFLRENPTAEELKTKAFKIGDTILDIPENEVAEFLKQNPNASSAINVPQFNIPGMKASDSTVKTEKDQVLTKTEDITNESNRIAEQGKIDLEKRKQNIMKKYGANEIEADNIMQGIENAKQAYTDAGREAKRENEENSVFGLGTSGAFGAGGLNLISGVGGFLEMLGLKDERKYSIFEKMQDYSSGLMEQNEDDGVLKTGWRTFLNSAPITASAIGVSAMTGGAGTPTVFGTLARGSAMAIPATGNKYLDLKRQYEIDQANVIGASLLSGLSEAVSEELGTFTNLDQMSKTIKQTVLQIGKEQSKQKIANLLVKNIGTQLGKGFLEEGSEEYVNTWAQALIDQSLLNKPLDMEAVSKQANEAFVMGGMSSIFLTPVFSATSLTNKVGKTEVIKDSGIYINTKLFNQNKDKAIDVARSYLAGKSLQADDEALDLMKSMSIDESASDTRDQNSLKNKTINNGVLEQKIFNLQQHFEDGTFFDNPYGVIDAIDHNLEYYKGFVSNEALTQAKQVRETIKQQIDQDKKNGMKPLDYSEIGKRIEELYKIDLGDPNIDQESVIQQLQQTIAELEDFEGELPNRYKHRLMRDHLKNIAHNIYDSFIENESVDNTDLFQQDDEINQDDIIDQDQSESVEDFEYLSDFEIEEDNAINAKLEELNEVFTMLENEEDIELISNTIDSMPSEMFDGISDNNFKKAIVRYKALKERISEESPQEDEEDLQNFDDIDNEFIDAEGNLVMLEDDEKQTLEQVKSSLPTGWKLHEVSKDNIDTYVSFVDDNGKVRPYTLDQAGKEFNSNISIQNDEKQIDNIVEEDIIDNNEQGEIEEKRGDNVERRTETGSTENKRELPREHEESGKTRTEQISEVSQQIHGRSTKESRITGTGEQSEDVGKINYQIGLNKKTLRGKEVISFDSENNKINTVYTIYELEDLVNSHDTSFNKRDEFVSSFQNRDLATQNSKQFIILNAQNFNAHRIINNYPDISNGSPVVTPGGIVLGGNTRTFMLKYANEKNFDKAIESYSNIIEDNAESFGINRDDLKDFKFPILVREIIGDMTIDQLRKIARDTNIQSNRVLSIEEQAIDDAKEITDDMMKHFNPTESGDILSPQNDKFVKMFLYDIVSDSQRNEYISEDQEYTQSLEQRIQNAIWVKVFGDSESSISLFKKMAVDTDNDIKIDDFGAKIGNAKKDRLRNYSNTINSITDADIIEKPLSKTFPRPDFIDLYDNGVDIDRLALMKLIYDKLPVKPRSVYKLSRYRDEVKSVIWLFKQLIDNKISKDDQKKIENQIPYVQEHIEFLKKCGFPQVDIKSSEYSFAVFENTGDSGRYGIVKGRLLVKVFKTIDEASSYFIDLVSEKKEKKSPNVSVYKERGKEGYSVLHKVAPGKYITLAEGFETATLARKYITENKANILEKLNELKNNSVIDRPDQSEKRKGIEYRKNNENVEPDIFLSTFNFRGVEFGNWVKNNERQERLNDTYDSLLDLAYLLDISPQALSLNGSLGLRFGSNGSGKANAHYEPDNIAINLTRTRGAGSLAHEWFHALDNYLSRINNNSMGYATEISIDKNMREELKESFKSLILGIKKTGFYKRSLSLDQTRSKNYWSTNVEMSARVFEQYVRYKLEEKDVQNDFLTSFHNEDFFSLFNSGKPYPYLREEEQKQIFPLVEKVLSSLNESDDHILFKQNSKLFLENIYDYHQSKVKLSKKLKEFSEEFFNQTKLRAQFKEDTEAMKDPKFIKADKIAKAFGLDGIVVFDSNIAGLDGAIYNNTIYISNSSKNPTDTVIKHELVHHIRLETESGYQALADILKESAEYRQHVSKNKTKLKELGYSDNIIDEELIADYIAEKINNKHFWEMISNKNAGLFTRIRTAVKYYWSLLRRKISLLGNTLVARVAIREIFKLESEINKIHNHLYNSNKMINVKMNANYKLADDKLVLINKINNLESLKVSVDLETNDWQTEMKKAKKFAYENFRNKSIINNDTKDPIIVNRKGIKETLQNTNISKLKSIYVLDQIIESGIKLAEINNEDTVKHPNIDKFEYYLTKIEIENKTYFVKTVIAVYDNKRFYDHSLSELIPIEKGDDPNSVGLTNTGLSEMPPSKVQDKRLYQILQEIFTESSMKFKLSDEIKAKLGSLDNLDKVLEEFEKMKGKIYIDNKKYKKELKEKIERQIRSSERESFDIDSEVNQMLKVYAKVNNIESLDEFVKKSTPDGRESTRLSYKEAEQMAKDDLNIDDETFDTLGQNGYDMAIATQRLKLKANAFFKQAINLAKQYKQGLNIKNLTDSEKEEIQSAIAYAYDQGNAFNMQYTLAKSNAGRILRYAREVKSVDDKEIDMLTKKAQKKEVEEFVKKIGETEKITGQMTETSPVNPISMSDLISTLTEETTTPDKLRNMKPELYDYLLMSYYTGLLSSPATHGRNIISTAMNVNIVEPIMNIIIDLVKHGKTTGFMGLGKGFVEGLHRSKEILTGKETADERLLSKFGTTQEIYTFDDTKIGDRIEKQVYRILTFVPKNLKAQDAIFYSQGFESSLPNIALELSMNKAYVKTHFGESINDQEAFKRLIENPTSEMIKKAKEYALDKTFNTPVPEGILGRFIKFCEEERLKAENRSSTLFLGYFSRIILPFTRVVANITNGLINYTPILSYLKYNVKRQANNELLKKNNDKYEDRIAKALNNKNTDQAIQLADTKLMNEIMLNRELRLQLAKSITGSILTALLFMLTDIISGGGSPDWKKNNQMKKTGWQEYSIKIGDKWISYKNFTPLNLVLAIVGDTADSFRYKKFDTGEIFSRFTYAFLGISNTILNQSFLTGLSDLIEMLAGRKEKDLEKMMVSSITVPSIVGWNISKYISDIFNPEIKNPEKISEKIMNELRILNQNDKIPNRIDTFGNVVEKRSPKTGIGDFALNSLGVTVGYESFDNPELKKITESVISVGLRLPESNGKVAIRIRGESIELEGENKEKFLKFRGERFTKLLLAHKNFINKISARINNGETHLEDILKKRLDSLHEMANEYGKNKIRQEILRK